MLVACSLCYSAASVSRRKIASGRIRAGSASVEHVTPPDLDAAWAIGERFVDQSFSIVDRASFAVMERLGVHRAIAFDDDFAVYRFGPGASTPSRSCADTPRRSSSPVPMKHLGGPGRLALSGPDVLGRPGLEPRAARGDDRQPEAQVGVGQLVAIAPRAQRGSGSRSTSPARWRAASGRLSAPEGRPATREMALKVRSPAAIAARIAR